MTELSECCQDYKNVSGTCEGMYFTVILNKIAIKYKGKTTILLINFQNLKQFRQTTIQYFVALFLE